MTEYLVIETDGTWRTETTDRHMFDVLREVIGRFQPVYLMGSTALGYVPMTQIGQDLNIVGSTLQVATPILEDGQGDEEAEDFIVTGYDSGVVGGTMVVTGMPDTDGTDRPVPAPVLRFLNQWGLNSLPQEYEDQLRRWWQTLQAEMLDEG